MTARNQRMIFVNLAVRDLKKSMEFFSRLGFEFNPQFTDQNAACMVISDTACAMLLTRDFFRNFTSKEICDTTKATEALIALSCNSRAEVDDLVHKALAAGGAKAQEPKDHGFMYGGSFYDVDGHHWEVMWMDPGHVQKSS